MAILNLPTFTEQKVKTPEEKLLESLQQMQIRPQAEVPRFTRYGNRMAERGGFDVLPQEQLRGMTQQQVDEYEAERRKARGAGISETLMRVGQAFAGRDADAGIVRRQQARQAQAQQARTKQLIEDYKKRNPEQADRIDLIMSGFDVSKLDKSDSQLFKGQGVANQFYNILLQGQQDASVRQSPMYKTAYDYLSQPKTETYINEVGQQVTRKIPGMISKDDYLPPTGVATVDIKPVDTEEPKVEEIVKVSPERRKTLQTQIDTVNNSERKILAFQKKLDEIQPNPLTRGEDRADIQSQYTSLLLELKNLEELGVLAGPDLNLLQSMVGDPTGFQQFFISGGTAGIKKQLNNLLSSIGDRKTPIYKELGMEEPEGTITQTRKKYYMPGGREIKVNATGDGWVYADTGEAVQQ
jgi:hypothetical protein